MKKFFAPIIFVLCLSLTACGNTSQQGAQLGDSLEDSFLNKIFNSISSFITRPEIDIFSEPEIVLDEASVELEHRYNEAGEHVGYYRETYGTNCGVSGRMLLEILDLDYNVLFSYTPQFAGQEVLVAHVGEGCISSIWDCDYPNGGYKKNYNSNIYYFLNAGDSYPKAYIEDRNGATTKLDFYDDEGNVVKTLTPVDPQNVLAVNFASQAYYEDEFICISEGRNELDEDSNLARIGMRDLYYDLSGNMLCEVDSSYTEVITKYGNSRHMRTRVEVKNAHGKVVRTYESTPSDIDEKDLHLGFYDLTAYYYPERDIVSVGRIIDSEDSLQIKRTTYSICEFFDLSDNKTIFCLDKTYQEGNNFIAEYSYTKGYIKAIGATKKSGYSKVEFYDKQGNFKNVIEAHTGELLGIEFRPCIDINDNADYIYIFPCDVNSSFGGRRIDI